MGKEYALRIPEEIEQRLLRCTSTMREAIASRLREIACAASKPLRSGARPAGTRAPALRFYVLEGYRIFYRLDRDSESVVVLELRPETA